MAASKKTTTDKTVNETDALVAAQPLAKALGKTAGQIWGIFVRKYFAKGVAELFAAIVITTVCVDKLWTHHWVWYITIPFPIAMLLVVDAIQLLINPHYPAMGDVENAIKRNGTKTNEVTIYNNR
jgi:uncharacterized membrane protein